MPDLRTDFSVVIPTTGSRAALLQCVESVLRQTHPAVEVVVVSDGNARRARKILEPVRDSRLRIVEQPRRGVAAARNLGVRASRGRWVAFLDDDDLAREYWLNSWRDCIDDDTVAVTARVMWHRGASNPVARPCRLSASDQTMGASSILAGGFVVRRDVLEAVGGYDEQLEFSENQDLGLRLCDHVHAAGLPRAFRHVDDTLVDIYVEDVVIRAGRHGDEQAKAAAVFLERYDTRLASDPATHASLLRILSRSHRIHDDAALARAAATRACRVEWSNLQNYRSLVVALLPGLEKPARAALTQLVFGRHRRSNGTGEPRPRAGGPPERTRGGLTTVMLSVVIPAFDVEPYIARTIRSLLEQDQPGLEVILVNDGSRDGTADVAMAELSTADPSRYRVISQPNAGVSAARNTGLRAASGDYVLFLDGDDFASPHLTQTLAGALRDRRPDVLCWAFDTLDPELRVARSYLSHYPARRHPRTGPQALREIVIEGSLAIWTGSAAYRKAFLLEHGLEFSQGCASGEDREFIYTALAVAKDVAFIGSVLSYYCLRADSLTNHFEVRQFESVLAHLRASDDLRSRSNPDLVLIADAILLRNAVGGYFRHLTLAVTQSDQDIRGILAGVDRRYPGLNRRARAMVWRSIRASREPSWGRLLFLLSPRAFAWEVRRRANLR